MLYKCTNIKQTNYANLGKKIEWSMIHMLMVYDREEEWKKIQIKYHINRILIDFSILMDGLLPTH